MGNMSASSCSAGSQPHVWCERQSEGLSSGPLRLLSDLSAWRGQTLIVRIVREANVADPRRERKGLDGVGRPSCDGSVRGLVSNPRPRPRETRTRHRGGFGRMMPGLLKADQ